MCALGPEAGSILRGHERCPYPCGPDSPLERLLELDAKMVYFGLPFLGFTFVHYIEHQIQAELAFPLYDREPMCARYRDAAGAERSVDVYVFSAEATHRRDVTVITGRMRSDGLAAWKRLGNTKIVVAGVNDALDTGLRLAREGIVPFREE